MEHAQKKNKNKQSKHFTSLAVSEVMGFSRRIFFHRTPSRAPPSARFTLGFDRMKPASWSPAESLRHMVGLCQRTSVVGLASCLFFFTGFRRVGVSSVPPPPEPKIFFFFQRAATRTRTVQCRTGWRLLPSCTEFPIFVRPAVTTRSQIDFVARPLPCGRWFFVCFFFLRTEILRVDHVR